MSIRATSCVRHSDHRIITPAQQYAGRVRPHARRFLYMVGEYRDSRGCFEQALTIFERTLGLEHPVTWMVSRAILSNN
jgi:hypothetical protein